MYLDYQNQIELMEQEWDRNKKDKKCKKNWLKAKKAAQYENLLQDIDYIKEIIGRKVEITESIYNLI